MSSIRHVLVLCAALLGFAGAAQAHPFTSTDMASLDRVSDPRLSPDGRWVLYDLRVADLAANKARHELWIAGVAPGGPAPHKLAVSQGGIGNARWAPDGRAIYFTSSRSGSAQVWRTDAAGAAAQQVTKLPLDVGSFKLSPDGHRLVVSMSVFSDCPTAACTKQRLDQKAAG